MLIEGAFLKLPELMLSSHSYSGNVEAMVVHYLSTGLQMELNSRSVPFPYNHITVEMPYPKQNKTGTVLRADLLFEAKGTVPSISRLEQYGYREMQWLEAKSYFSKGKSRSSKTQNVGRLVKDIMRLCLLPEEYQGAIRQNGRYVLLVFDSEPSNYLAFSGRDWLPKIFEERTPKINIDLNSEKSSLISSIIKQRPLSAELNLTLSVTHFKPSSDIPSPVYWGYLMRIDKFSISLNGKMVQSNGDTHERWSKDKIMALEEVRSEFLMLLKADEGDVITS